VNARRKLHTATNLNIATITLLLPTTFISLNPNPIPGSVREASIHLDNRQSKQHL
jgi:hypothetical protein